MHDDEESKSQVKKLYLSVDQLKKHFKKSVNKKLQNKL